MISVLLVRTLKLKKVYKKFAQVHTAIAWALLWVQVQWAVLVAMDWMCSPNIRMLKSYPTPPPCDYVVDKVFREVIKVKEGHKGGALIWLTWCPYIKRKIKISLSLSLSLSLCLSLPYEDTVDIYKLGGELPPGTKSSWHLDLRLPSLQICKKINFYYLSPPGYGIV